MRWRHREHRIVKRFALFPIEAKTRSSIFTVKEWRWLEIVYLYQSYDWPFWWTINFATKEEYYEYISMIKKEKETE